MPIIGKTQNGADNINPNTIPRAGRAIIVTLNKTHFGKSDLMICHFSDETGIDMAVCFFDVQLFINLMYGHPRSLRFRGKRTAGKNCRGSGLSVK